MFHLSKFPSAALTSLGDVTGIAALSYLAEKNLSCVKH